MLKRMVRPAVKFGEDHGLIHEAVVTGRKVGAGREFWSRLAHDEALFRRARVFVESGGPEQKLQDSKKRGREKKGISATVSLGLASEILGASKILPFDKVCSLWNKEVPQDTPIRYSEELLVEFARQNKEVNTDWRLVYYVGTSLRQQREVIGVDIDHQPCFYHGSTWWLDAKEDGWATKTHSTGYYPVDYSGRWPKTNWDLQEEEIKKLGDGYKRTPEAIIAETIVSNFKIHDGERLLETWWHWGSSLDSSRYRVRVGVFDRGGLDVNVDHPEWVNGGALRVCLLREFQIKT